MKVYIAEQCYMYEPGEIIGVYSTREAALARLIEEDNPHCGGVIHTVELDQPYQENGEVVT